MTEQDREMLVRIDENMLMLKPIILETKEKVEEHDKTIWIIKSITSLIGLISVATISDLIVRFINKHQ
jgi:hypothetical protein